MSLFDIKVNIDNSGIKELLEREKEQTALVIYNIISKRVESHIAEGLKREIMELLNLRINLW